MKSKQILETRTKLDMTIGRYWNILYSENLMYNNTGLKRNYDMKKILESIQNMAIDRVSVKLDSIAVNMGLKSRKDFSKDSAYPVIYMLAELNEQYVKLSKVRTINPIMKQKYGKKNLIMNEVLTASFIKGLREKLQNQMTALEKKLTEFNERDFDTNGAYLFLTYGQEDKVSKAISKVAV